MEVVGLILGPTLTSRPCSHTFWVLTSLHLPFLLKMFFVILVVTLVWNDQQSFYLHNFHIAILPVLFFCMSNSNPLLHY